VTDRLSQLKEALDKATEGPWEFSNTTDVRGYKGELRAPNPYNGFALISAFVNEADFAAIVLLRNNADDLIAVAEAAKAFVATTSYYSQVKASRPEFEALALSLLRLRGG